MNVWQESHSELVFYETDRLNLPIQLVVAAVSDRLIDLDPLEQEAIARAVTKRRNEFSTGRWCARKAISLLDPSGSRQPLAIPQGKDRAPLWPAGYIGSITHIDTLASAALAQAGELSGLGHDIERQGRLQRDLWSRLFTELEQGKITNDEQATVLFSAKEAVYKAVNPLVGDFIGFQEAELDWDWSTGRFSAHYLGSKPANNIMSQGQGWFWIWPELVLSLFVIPPSDKLTMER